MYGASSDLTCLLGMEQIQTWPARWAWNERKTDLPAEHGTSPNLTYLRSTALMARSRTSLDGTCIYDATPTFPPKNLSCLRDRRAYL